MKTIQSFFAFIIIANTSVAGAVAPRHERRAMITALESIWPEGSAEQRRGLVHLLGMNFDRRSGDEHLFALTSEAAHAAALLREAMHRRRVGEVPLTGAQFGEIVQSILLAHQISASRACDAAHAATAWTAAGISVAACSLVVTGRALGWFDVPIPEPLILGGGVVAAMSSITMLTYGLASLEDKIARVIPRMPGSGRLSARWTRPHRIDSMWMNIRIGLRYEPDWQALGIVEDSSAAETSRAFVALLRELAPRNSCSKHLELPGPGISISRLDLSPR